MKFYAEPFLTVYEQTKKPVLGDRHQKIRQMLCQFNAIGEFETFDAELIAKLTPKYQHENNAKVSDAIQQFTCKKCDFTCGTPIELAHHSRKVHPKNGEDK